MSTTNREYEQWKDNFVKKLQSCLQYVKELRNGGEVSVETFSHVNQGHSEGLVMTGLNESGISPVIYLDHLFNCHKEGVSDEKLVQETVTQFVKYRNLKANTKLLRDYEQVKEHLRIRVVGATKNEFWADEKVSLVEGDFIHSCYLSFCNDEFGYATIDVSKRQADNWQVSYEQVIEDARKGSTNMKVELCSVTQILAETQSVENYMEYPDLLPEQESLFSLREQGSPFGASVIARLDILHRVGEILKDDYYILPSSVEEVLLIPARYWEEPGELNEMVRKINEKEVLLKDRLSSQVQYYDRGTKCMINVNEWMGM